MSINFVMCQIAYTDVGIPKSSTREIRLLSALKHPNIVKLREIVVEDGLISVLVIMFSKS